MKKINILEVIWGMEVGGAENVVRMLSEKIDNKRFNVVVCCLSTGGYYAYILRKKGIKVYVLDKKKGIDFSIIKKIRKVIRKEKIDIVHTHLWTADLWARIAAIFEKKKIVTTLHNMGFRKKKYHLIIDKLFSCFTKKVVCVCNAIRLKYIKDAKLKKNKLVVIYNGIEQEKFSKEVNIKKKKEKLEINKDEFVVGVVGSLTPVKDHIYFLNAAKKIIEKLPNVKFLIVGDGPLKDFLISQVKKLGLEKNVLFLGKRSDISELLNIMDVYVLSSSSEGLSISLIEAMVSKKAIVATNVGGNSELIEDEVNGFLVPAKNSAVLAKKIVRLLKDKNLRIKYSNNHKNKLKTVSTKIMVEDYENLFSSI